MRTSRPVDGERVPDPLGCSQSRSGGRERREDAVSGGLDDRAAAAPDRGAQYRIVTVEHRLPSLVAEGRGALRGGDEIGVHDGREDALRRWESSFADDEVGDLGDEGVDIAEEREVVGAVEFDDGRTADLSRRESDSLGGRVGVVPAVQDQGRSRDLREELIGGSGAEDRVPDPTGGGRARAGAPGPGVPRLGTTGPTRETERSGARKSSSTPSTF